MRDDPEWLQARKRDFRLQGMILSSWSWKESCWDGWSIPTWVVVERELKFLFCWLVLSEVQSFSQSQVSGQMSVVYHLFTVWFLIFYHYNYTLDHPECRSELLWIIQSISPNLWMVQSDNLGDFFKFLPTIDCNTNYLLFTSQSLTAMMTLA